MPDLLQGAWVPFTPTGLSPGWPYLYVSVTTGYGTSASYVLRW